MLIYLGFPREKSPGLRVGDVGDWEVNLVLGPQTLGKAASHLPCPSVPQIVPSFLPSTCNILRVFPDKTCFRPDLDSFRIDPRGDSRWWFLTIHDISSKVVDLVKVGSLWG